MAGLMAKRQGQSKGFPDLINPITRKAAEFKVGTKITTEQKAWLEALRQHGWDARLITTFDQFKQLVEGDFVDAVKTTVV